MKLIVTATRTHGRTKISHATVTAFCFFIENSAVIRESSRKIKQFVQVAYDKRPKRVVLTNFCVFTVTINGSKILIKRACSTAWQPRVRLCRKTRCYHQSTGNKAGLYSK